MRKTCISITTALALGVLCSAAVGAESPTGRWKTIDDETGRTKSIVEIGPGPGGTLSGKVVQILQSDKGPHPLCDACDGERKNQPIEGMTILWDLKPDGDHVWSGGTVLDPSKGKTYRAKLTLDEGGEKLQLRGYIGIEALGRTQTWLRE
jgi:uncharacterized protein (DUF2147 family)